MPSEIKLLIILLILIYGNRANSQEVVLDSLPQICIYGLSIESSLSFLPKIGESSTPDEREADEAYGVDSILYVRRDSFEAIYLKEGDDVFLGGFISKCTSCITLSTGDTIRVGEPVERLVRKSEFIRKTLQRQHGEEWLTAIRKKRNISFSVSNGEGAYVYPWQVNLHLEEGVVKRVNIQVLLE